MADDIAGDDMAGDAAADHAIAERVREALRRVKGPDLVGSIVDQGLVSPVTVSDGAAMFSISVPAERAEELAPLQRAAQQVAEGVEGVRSAIVVLTAERKGGDKGSGQTAPPPAAPPLEGNNVRAATMPPPHEASPARPRSPAAAPPGQGAAQLPEGVSHIVAVASGKGGVGKSTTAVNLAAALRLEGMSVGILDADVYGPSMPRLLGLSRRPSAGASGNLKPLLAHGMKVMSMGLLVEEDTPMIWRGPMVIQALTQMLRQVDWGVSDGQPDPLDVIVVDMPPGTGDIALSLAQSVPLSGAVVVSTPQDLALIDARKGIGMFERVNVPVLGIVENMSQFVCPSCGTVSAIFGHGGARDEAKRRGLPFLGEVPLEMAIRESADAGVPVTLSHPDGPHAAAYRSIAVRVKDALGAGAGAGAGPSIVFE